MENNAWPGNGIDAPKALHNHDPRQWWDLIDVLQNGNKFRLQPRICFYEYQDTKAWTVWASNGDAINKGIAELIDQGKDRRKAIDWLLLRYRQPLYSRQ